MKLGVLKETEKNECRVALTPQSAKQILSNYKLSILIQTGAGLKSFFNDNEYELVGCEIVKRSEDVIKDSDVILKVRYPAKSELLQLKSTKLLIGLLEPYDKVKLENLKKTKITAFALELIPRISRAQSIDVLSSQANIAGYKAVLIAANYFTKIMPMLMTAAGTIKAARVLIMGVGVAGLQAIATAKRLGCIVEANDVRRETKEQVESLGAKFLEVPQDSDENKTGAVYASEMSDEFKKKQAELIHSHVSKADIVITTALVPGKIAPLLISEKMVKSMKSGSVIVDMAVVQGGNCEGSEIDKVIDKHGVIIVGMSNLPSLVSKDASGLYSNNMMNFLKLIIDSENSKIKINNEDEIIKASLICGP